MSTLSDLIEEYIRQILDESQEGMLCIRRRDLSGRFSCVPSQINYVIKTRFTLERGYLVESKRGEGGYLRIIRLPLCNASSYVEQLGIGQESALEREDAQEVLKRLVREEILSSREADLLWQLLRDESIPAGQEERALLRGLMLRNLVAYLAGEKGEKK